MLKKVTFSLFAILLVASLTFAGNAVDQQKAKKIDPSSEVAEGLNKLPAKNMSKVSQSQLGFTDYDYAGNSTVNEQVWPYDIDGDGVLDPVGTFMQRFNTSGDGTRSNQLAVGIGGEFATIPLTDGSVYSGWGTVQSITAGPWAGHVASMFHAGGVSTLTVVDLATFEYLYFHEPTDVEQNFPTFAYLDDGRISMTATDGVFRTTTAAAPTVTVDVGTTVFDAGDSEFPIRKSPNGEYLVALAQTDGVGLDPANVVMMYTSNDGGATWTEEQIAANTDPVANRPGLEALFTNFGQKSYAVDNSGVVHVGYNGFSVDTSTDDSASVFPALYWNSRDRDWIAVSDPAEEHGSELLDQRPGNGIGNAYPTPVVSEDGNIVAVMYQAPEYDGGVLQTGGDTPAFYTDIKLAVSEDGGRSFGTPTKVAGEPLQSDVYPSAYDWLSQEANTFSLHFMWLVDAVPGCSLFDGGNAESEDSYWNYMVHQFDAVSVEDNEELATSFSLDQNYPNPFNPTTTIKYSVPELTNVSLKVYDVLGKEVATLVNEQQVGVQEINFDASDLSSGLYIYTIKAGNFTSSKKMMLMK